GDGAAVAGRVVPGGAPGLVVGRLRHGGCAGRVDDGGVDGEAVVVRGDLDLAGGAVEHGLVDAAVAVAELVGAVPEGAAEDLVAEADAEERDAAVQDGAQQLDLVLRRG